MCFLFCYSLNGQTGYSVNSCFDQVRRLNHTEVECFIRSSKEFKLYDLYALNQLSFLKSGAYDEEISNSIITEFEALKEPLYYITIGDIEMANAIETDTISYKNYLLAYEIAGKRNNPIEACEAAKRINRYLFKNQNNIEIFEEWAKRYQDLAYDEYEKVYSGFFQVGSMMSQKYYNNKGVEPIPLALSLLERARKSKFYYLEARLSQLLGVNYDLFHKDIEKALFYYNKSLNIYQRSDYYLFKTHINDLVFNIGTLEQERGNLEEAMKFYRLIDKNGISSFDTKDLITINDYIYRNFKLQNKLDSAIVYLERKYSINDSLDLSGKAKAIAELETKYQTAEKEKQILKEQQRAETNRNWLIVAVLALFLGSGIAILIQKNTIKKQLLAEQEVLLKQQRVENLLKEQELVGIDAMISGQEKERQRLANDLHDNLGSVLTSLKMHFLSLRQGLSHQEELEITRKTEALMEEAYQKVRNIAHLRNAGLKASKGLLPAVHSFAKKVSILDKLVVNVEEHGMTERLENSLEITIFRIIQELVTNVAKHAEATECTVHITNHNHALNIMVEDNGKGFDGKEITKKEGIGLYSIQKRVENLDGQVTIDSIPNKGTSIIIDIPLA